MKLYNREEFIKMPYGTIYSRVTNRVDELMSGLYCKKSTGEDFENDWIEQDLIAQDGYGKGGVSFDHFFNLRDSHQEFETAMDLAGRDGMFDDGEVLVVWGKKDIMKLLEYLNNGILVAYDNT